jgi:sugar-specific transcriptional regulator TrmB
VADFVAQYRQLWEARLDRLDDYLTELQSKEQERKPPADATTRGSAPVTDVPPRS